MTTSRSMLGAWLFTILLMPASAVSGQAPRFVVESRSPIAVDDITKQVTQRVEVIRDAIAGTCRAIYHTYVGTGDATPLGLVTCRFSAGTRFLLVSRTRMDATHEIDVVLDPTTDQCWAVYHWRAGGGGVTSLADIPCKENRVMVAESLGLEPRSQ